MNTYWFEIVTRGHDRYSWILVERKDGRLTVLASGRDRGKKRKVRAEVERLRALFADAEVVDATQASEVPLPHTSFRRVQGVVPLLVGDRWTHASEGDGLTAYGAATATGQHPGQVDVVQQPH